MLHLKGAKHLHMGKPSIPFKGSNCIYFQTKMDALKEKCIRMRGQIPTILEESWNVGNVKSNKRIRVFLTYNSTISLKKLVSYKKCFKFVKMYCSKFNHISYLHFTLRYNSIYMHLCSRSAFTFNTNLLQ